MTDFKGDNDDDRIVALEESCGKIIGDKVITHSDDNFEEKYLQAREWCAEKTDSN